MINGGFGLVLDGSKEAEERAKMMLSWDVSNGVSKTHYICSFQYFPNSSLAVHSASSLHAGREPGSLISWF